MITNRIKRDIEEEIIPEFQSELDKLSGKTILITGGNGFLPSYLVDTFAVFNKKLENPVKLILLNKNDIGENSRLSHLIGDENVSFVAQDVGQPFEIEEKVDIIIHAASRANPTAFLADPIDTINANVNGLRTLLEYASKNPVEQFIFFSSGENYGNPVKEFVPTPETYSGNVDPLSRHACYIEAKRFCETMLMAYYREYKIPVKMLRILLVYGPGIRNDGKVVSDFFNMAIKERNISLRDKGDALRSFCYVSDAVRAILGVVFYGASGEAYNISDDRENVSIRELAGFIAKTVGDDVKVFPNMDAEEKKIYGVDTRNLDISKVRALGFKPRVSLEEGLFRLRKHYEEAGLITADQLNSSDT